MTCFLAEIPNFQQENLVKKHPQRLPHSPSTRGVNVELRAKEQRFRLGHARVVRLLQIDQDLNAEALQIRAALRYAAASIDLPLVAPGRLPGLIRRRI